MSLLDAFLLEFGTDGLDELNDDVENADNKLNKFEKDAKKAEKTVKDLGKAIEKDGTKRVKAFVLQLTKTVAPMALFGKALKDSMQFAADAIEVADAAAEAGMSLEEFQAQDGNKYALFSKDDVNNAKEYEQVMRDVRMGTASIGSNISKMLLPALTAVAKIIRKITDFFAGQSTLIKVTGVLSGIALGITGIAQVIKFVANPAIRKMGMRLWAALAPIIVPVMAVIAAIAALALIIEDLIVWVNGGESAFGDLWSEIFGGVEGAKKLFDELMQVFKQLWEVAQPILKGLAQLIMKGVFYALKGIVWAIAAIVKGIKKLTGGSVDVDVNENVNGSHADGLDYVPFDGYIAKLHKGERIQTRAEADDWRSGLIAAKRAINFTSQFPLNSIPQGSISNAYSNSNSNRTIQIGDITIQTQATSAQGIADDLASAIKRAVISLDDGMLA